MVGFVVDQPDTSGGAQSLAGLGDRIRGLRVERGFDRKELAAHGGFDAEYLISVERGDASPSLEVLSKLAGVLGIELAELFVDRKPGPAVVVLRGAEVPTVESGSMAVQVLTPRAVVPGLYAARYRLWASGGGMRPVRHEGHDWLYVFRGQLRVDFEQEHAVLSVGDSVSFSSRVPHQLAAVGDEPAEFLAVGATLPGTADSAPGAAGTGSPDAAAGSAGAV